MYIFIAAAPCIWIYYDKYILQQIYAFPYLSFNYMLFLFRLYLSINNSWFADDVNFLQCFLEFFIYAFIFELALEYRELSIEHSKRFFFLQIQFNFPFPPSIYLFYIIFFFEISLEKFNFTCWEQFSFRLPLFLFLLPRIIHDCHCSLFFLIHKKVI